MRVSNDKPATKHTVGSGVPPETTIDEKAVPGDDWSGIK